MLRIILLAVVTVFALFLSTLMSVGDVMPQPTAHQQELLLGFAETQGASCAWKTPTVLDYILNGRPKLFPNAVCGFRVPTTLTPFEQATTIREQMRDAVKIYFAKQEFIVGFKFKNADAALVCYNPMATVRWTRCVGDPEKGCQMAKCSAGLPPE